MTVRDTISQKAKKSSKKIIYKKSVLPIKFANLARKEYTGKRLLDIVLSLTGLILFALLYPIIFFGTKVSSRGPVLFKQNRTGLNGRSFLCYKLRTMHSFYDSPSHEKPAITQKGDVRIFRFGRFLRKSNLDELPQLLNVLKGDMSLVGPRPYMEDECTLWNGKFDDFYYRYAVRPGITGLAQSKGFRGGTFDENHMRKRLNLDLIYVEKQSFLLDAKIILKTVLQMLHLNTNAH